MKRLKQICSVTVYNFRKWNKNPRIYLMFILAFILCFLLSDKAVQFARLYETLVMALIMLLMNLKKGYMGGVISVFVFSLYGFLLNPETIKTIFHLPDALMYKANVAVGWLSPLNHATYHMHNFGYDLLPRLWQTYLIFGILIILIFFLLLRAARNYSFHFLGTEG